MGKRKFKPAIHSDMVLATLQAEVERLRAALEEIARDPRAGIYVTQVVDEALNPDPLKAAQ